MQSLCNTNSFHITQQNELGLPEDADEYDLDVALNNNTDAGITKIIAGSFILVMLALLVVGLVIPSITDYGDGVCDSESIISEVNLLYTFSMW